jgi:hypothetical protein
MASSIASLFGPSAEEIVYAQQQQDMARRQAAEQQGMAMQSSPLAQQFYQSGLNITKGLGGLFGTAPMQDPRLGRNIQLRKILGSTGIEDLNDADKVSALSSSLGKAGLAQEALYFADRAKDLKAYELELATALEPVLISEVVTKDGRAVGRNKYNQYFTLDDMKPVDPGSLQSVRLYEKDIAAGSDEPSVSSQTSIEQSFLADTDLDLETKKRAANYLDQQADIILREPAFKGATKEQALAEAYKRAIRDKVIVNEAFPITFGDRVLFTTESLGGLAGLGRQDWKFNPPSPLAPTTVNEDGAVVRRDFTQVGTK